MKIKFFAAAFACFLISSAGFASQFGPPPLPPMPPMPPGYPEWENGDNTSFESAGPELPGEGGGIDPGVTNAPAFNYTNGLWLDRYTEDTNWISLKLHGTHQDEFYELFSKTNLSDADGVTERGFLGSDGTTFIPPVSISGYSNAFFWARHSSLDTDGDGLPDWWELENGSDPYSGNSYGDADGDGWTDMEEFRNGTSPAQFDTPPAPQGLKAVLDGTGNLITLSWQPSSGAVTGYILEYGFEDNTVATLAASQTTYQDSTFARPRAGGTQRGYRLRAAYDASLSAPSQWVYPLDPAVSPNASIVRGPQGNSYLVVSAMPSEAVGVRLSKSFYNSSIFARQTNIVDLAASNSVNGVFAIPVDETPLFQRNLWWAQVLLANGEISHFSPAGDDSGIPFFDGREHLQQNLEFQLRVADRFVPFAYYSSGNANTPIVPAFDDYVYASYKNRIDFDDRPVEFRPFIDNYLYRNFIFSPSDLATNSWNSGELATGVSRDNGKLTIGPVGPGIPLSSLKYEFGKPSTRDPIPALLYPATSIWHFPRSYDLDGLIFSDGLGNHWMGYGTNFFGLDFESAKAVRRAVVGNGFEFGNLAAGNSIPWNDGKFYPAIVRPILQTTNYYFGRVGIDRLPGDEEFSVTNTTPLMIISGNQPSSFFQVAGFAKQSILNGDPNKFGYLGQYFDKAWKADGNGLPSTNQTGVLSEYGDFFPTEPGPTFLETKPNFGETNTTHCLVHVIKLELDVNHDGVIDRSFAGPDNTSSQRPFVFWVNNDLDFQEKDVKAPPSNGLKDYEGGMIQDTRGLEDFARLWISGIPTMDSSYEVELSMITIEGEPAINLYSYNAESSGGTGYLTDTNIAQAFVHQYALSKVGGFSTYTFPPSYFANADKKHFLFEGAGIGKGQLVLTIRKSGQTVAQTFVWLDLKDIKSMYEMAVADNAPSAPPSDLITRCANINTVSSNPDEAKQIIVFVHGVNNTHWEFENSSETAFKRLYWAGYTGRFVAFRWISPLLPDCAATIPRGSPFNYNNGEFVAFKSASAFATCLNRLRARFPDYSINVLAHSMGNIVASEALRLGGAFDTYIMSQAAVPAHCYDTSVPFLQKLLDAEANDPTPLQASDGGYHGYFANLTGRIVNLYNPADYALVDGTCLGFDTNWEKNHETEKPVVTVFPATRYLFNTNTLESAFSVILNGVTTYRTLSDPYEKIAMVARSRTKAVGAMNVVGVVSAAASADLSSNPFGFQNTRSEHSAQFTRNIQTSKAYYDKIIDIIDQP